MTREVQPCRKLPFVMEPDGDKPGEYCGPGMSKRIHLFGTALYDELVGKYRMWYFGRMGPHWRVPNGNYQIPGLYVPRTDERPYHCNGVTADSYGRAFVDNDRGDLTLYAESDDGINWVKPSLGIFTFDGSGDNNIIWDLHGASVLIDREDEDPEKRYKAIGFCRRYRGIFLLTSPDGIHWDDSDHLDPVVRRSNEGAFNVIDDRAASLYRAYSIQRFDDVHKRRVICCSESPSLAGPWKDSYPILEPSSWDDEIARRRYGALRAEFHNLSAFRYNNAPLSGKGASDTGIHLGLLGVLYATAEQAPGEKNQMPCDGPIDAQFVYSRDGINWRHADRARTAALPRGDGDAFDRGMIIGTAKEPILGGDEVHWFYTGCEHTHGELEMEKRVKRLGRATWRRDRFAALAAAGEGMVVTKPLLPPPCWPGYALEINADAAGGQLRVELCGRDGRALEGFSREDCTPLQTDDMHWKIPLARFPTGANDPVQLRFFLNRSKLYSFKF